MALTADRAELAKGFRRRTGRWPNEQELDRELRFQVRAALDRELDGRRPDPVRYEKAVDKISGRLTKALAKGAVPARPSRATEYEQLAVSVTDPIASDGFARLAKEARAAGL